MTDSLTQTAVDANTSLVETGRYQFWGQIKRNGLPYDLSGKTVTATVRQYMMPRVILADGEYEDITVTNGNPDTPESEGGVLWEITFVRGDFPVPTVSTDTTKYQVRYWVAEDFYAPQLLLFDLAPASRA